MNELDDKTLRTFICEVCDTTVELTDQRAFDEGWDYPPFMGAPGVISPRTCGMCGIQDTVWWDVMISKKSLDELTEHQLEVVARIQAEVQEEKN